MTRREIVLDTGAIQRLLGTHQRLQIQWVSSLAAQLRAHEKGCRCSVMNTPQWRSIFNTFKQNVAQAGPADRQKIKAVLGADTVRVIMRRAGTITQFTF